jgi:D-xylose transport system substrate-binding protein
MTKLVASKRGRKHVAAVAVLSLAAIAGAALMFTAVGSAGPNKARATIQVCALLPDTTSSVRYQLYDKPSLEAAFKKAGLTYSVLNALGSTQTQRSQGDQCITNGAKVILVDALDSGTGAAIEAAAAAKGVKIIDYDRLVLKGKASYYVSFDNPTVGKVMARGLIAALKANGKYGKHPVVSILNGGITDNNAKLFKQGYDSILNPLFKRGIFTKAKAGDQWTDWDYQKGLRIFEQMLAANSNHIDASIAANDNLANAVVTALKARKLSPIPLTGQDATPQGVQNIISGYQTGTVFKNLKQEAATAAAVAIALIKGKKVTTNGRTDNGVRKVPSVLLNPIWVTKKNYKLLFKLGFLKRSDVCKGTYKKYCT